MKTFKILFLFVVTLIFSSCIEDELYIDEMIYNVKNISDSTLHVSLLGGSKYDYREAIVYPKHTAFLHSDYKVGDPNFGFNEGLNSYDSCIVRLNDAEGEILKIWTKEENCQNEAKDFFNQRWWQSKSIDTYSNSTEFTFFISMEDLEMSSAK